MTSPFENLAGPGKALRAEPPDANEFAGLQRMGLARLHDARNLGEYEGMLEVDSRLVADLITAYGQVAAKLAVLPPIQNP